MIIQSNYSRRSPPTRLSFIGDIQIWSSFWLPASKPFVSPRVKKGAPIQSLLSEGVGEIGGAVSILKDAPHPIAALLWTRWALSEEGQRVWAQAGETPAHPQVEPLEKVRPKTTYMLNIDDLKEFPKYEKIWKEIFQIR